MIFHFKPNISFVALVIFLSVFWKAFWYQNDFGNDWINNFSKDDYFGEGEIHADDETIYQYKIVIDYRKIDDLKDRMKVGMERMLQKKAGYLADMQMNLQFLKELSDALQLYNWKQHQHFINTFRHYRTEIEGLRIHFIRTTLRDSYKRIYPIILLHGWHSTFWEFYKIVPILSNPDRFGFDFGLKEKIAFDVIVPSIPGLIFSDHPSRTGLGLLESARILAKLADRLSLDQFLLFGYGEMGCKIATMIALLRPETLAGLYLLNLPLPAADQNLSMLGQFSCKLGLQWWITVCDSERLAFDNNSGEYRRAISSKLHLYGPLLLESPVAAAEVILEHWASRTDPEHQMRSFSNLSSFFTVDDLLTNIFLHWSTNSLIPTYQLMEDSTQIDQLDRSIITAPAAILINSPKLLRIPQQWQYASRYRNITRFRINGHHGDFLALQDANLLAEEIFSFTEALNG